MHPPSTFRTRSYGVFTILNKAAGREIDPRRRPVAAFTLACNCATHAEAIESIIAHGIAEDAADADALIYEAETQNDRGTL